ncbi:MAG: thioredoxin [Candidatus Aminicenantes bacterium]|jgi:thioredoxin 1
MASEQILELNETNFKETISQGVTLVDFWAQWCLPCRALNPILEKIAGKMSHKAKICKLNIDENPDISVEYNVMSIPAIFIYKDGQVVNQLFGLRTEEELVQAINAAE